MILNVRIFADTKSIKLHMVNLMTDNEYICTKRLYVLLEENDALYD